MPTGPAGKMLARGEFVVRNGYVLTMDETLGDILDGDVHVKNGAIVAVGENLKVPGATVLDARRLPPRTSMSEIAYLQRLT